MNKQTRALVEAARQAIKQLDGVHEGRAAVRTLEAALAPIDRAALAPRLAWSKDTEGGLHCTVAGTTYTVYANGNEPEGSAIRWMAMRGNVPLSDGEPRQRDAKERCFYDAQRIATHCKV